MRSLFILIFSLGVFVFVVFMGLTFLAKVEPSGKLIEEPVDPALLEN